MNESFEALQAELARLMNLIQRAREAGNDALAESLKGDAARCLMDLADIHTPVQPPEPEQPVAQQQQQIQSDKDEPEDKE
jgi:hypothetical protein